VELQTTSRRGGGAASLGRAGQPIFHGRLWHGAGQILRRDFPNETARLVFRFPPNRSAQAIMESTNCNFRQGQLQGPRDQNQILVDVSSAASACARPRARYSTARDTGCCRRIAGGRAQEISGAATFNYIMCGPRARRGAISETTANFQPGPCARGFEQVLG